MSDTTWKPSPILSVAIHKAMVILAAHWPKAMANGLESSDAGAAFSAVYARAMMGADLDAIPEAAMQWAMNNLTPPKPVELGKLARAITRERRPVLQVTHHGGGTFARAKVFWYESHTGSTFLTDARNRNVALVLPNDRGVVGISAQDHLACINGEQAWGWVERTDMTERLVGVLNGP